MSSIAATSAPSIITQVDEMDSAKFRESRMCGESVRHMGARLVTSTTCHPPTQGIIRNAQEIFTGGDEGRPPPSSPRAAAATIGVVSPFHCFHVHMDPGSMECICRRLLLVAVHGWSTLCPPWDRPRWQEWANQINIMFHRRLDLVSPSIFVLETEARMASGGRYHEVARSYVPAVTPYIESQLAHVGRVRVAEAVRRGVHASAAISVTKDVAISHFTDAQDIVWMQASVQMFGHVLDVHRFLLQRGSKAAAHPMQQLLGHSIMDCYTLAALHPDDGRPHERMHINWMAMLPPHTSYSDRDYLFLHYADVYSSATMRSLQDDAPAADGPLVACHVWESIDLDGCDRIPHLNLSRQRLSSWGFLVQALDDHGLIRVSLTVNQPKATAHRSWMEKLLLSLGRIESLLYDHVDSSPCCNVCFKSFSILRRRVQCKRCKLSCCGKCVTEKGDARVVLCRACMAGKTKGMSLLQRTGSRQSSSSTSSDLEASSSSSGHKMQIRLRE
ncbi:Aste57867_15659 [Aphanomyces stellatus]|uniref:Aste57867_15659 protein n=1 Tax=Aphanomyces stellatus TaxID=120398 RepID=A0A485L6K9_9STRA|nr:hypothetical protein As57867_015603 [Aphanomyces stellatus]VFT92454.1 Aste57867_15659 [Aphanomyces stellatus]